MTFPMIRASRPERMLVHRFEHSFGRRGRNNREQLAFVGHVQRIESQHLARALNFLPDRNRLLF